MNHLQSLLQDGLISTSHVEHAAIIRRKDSSLRASSVGFMLDPEELSCIVKFFREPTLLRSEGFHLTSTNQEYHCLRSDKNSIYARVEGGNEGGVIIVKTNTLVIIATYANNMYPSICVEAVENLADYFRDKAKWWSWSVI